jgi:hypothetical protein
MPHLTYHVINLAYPLYSTYLGAYSYQRHTAKPGLVLTLTEERILTVKLFMLRASMHFTHAAQVLVSFSMEGCSNLQRDPYIFTWSSCVVAAVAMHDKRNILTA